MGNSILPGIRQIEYCFANELTITEPGFIQEDDPVSVKADFHDMEISGLAECEVSRKWENGQYIYETKMSFYTGKDPVITDQFLCYRLTTVDGTKFLLGTGSRPFPLREWKRTFPDQSTGRQGYDITIRYKNTHSILPIAN